MASESEPHTVDEMKNDHPQITPITQIHFRRFSF